MAEEYFDAEIITLTDEDGNENQFEVIATCEVGENIYHAMIPLDEDGKDESGEYVILRADIDDDGDEILSTIEDDDEFDRVADIFEDSFAEIDYDDPEGEGADD